MSIDWSVCFTWQTNKRKPQQETRREIYEAINNGYLERNQLQRNSFSAALAEEEEDVTLPGLQHLPTAMYCKGGRIFRRHARSRRTVVSNHTNNRNKNQEGHRNNRQARKASGLFPLPTWTTRRLRLQKTYGICAPVHFCRVSSVNPTLYDFCPDRKPTRFAVRKVLAPQSNPELSFGSTAWPATSATIRQRKPQHERFAIRISRTCPATRNVPVLLRRTLPSTASPPPASSRRSPEAGNV